MVATLATFLLILLHKALSMSIEAVVFDIDGTLVHSTPHCLQTTNALLVSNSKRALTEEEYKAATKWDTPTRFTVHLHGEESLSSPNFSTLFNDGQRLGSQFDSLYVSSLTSSNCPLFDDVKEPLVKLQREGIQVAALTNSCVAYADKVMSSHSLTSTFSIVEGSDTVPSSKPSPLGLLQICTKLEVDPFNVLMVGDAVGDGTAGVEAGCKSLGVGWGSYEYDVLQESKQFTEGVVKTRGEMWDCIERLIGRKLT